MRDVFEEDDDYESNSPVLLSVPQLEGPIAFMKEALKNWGWAHIDNSEQSVCHALRRDVSHVTPVTVL